MVNLNGTMTEKQSTSLTTLTWLPFKKYSFCQSGQGVNHELCMHIIHLTDTRTTLPSTESSENEVFYHTTFDNLLDFVNVQFETKALEWSHLATPTNAPLGVEWLTCSQRASHLKTLFSWHTTSHLRPMCRTFSIQISLKIPYSEY